MAHGCQPSEDDARSGHGCDHAEIDLTDEKCLECLMHERTMPILNFKFNEEEEDDDDDQHSFEDLGETLAHLEEEKHKKDVMVSKHRRRPSGNGKMTSRHSHKASTADNTNLRRSATIGGSLNGATSAPLDVITSSVKQNAAFLPPPPPEVDMTRNVSCGHSLPKHKGHHHAAHHHHNPPPPASKASADVTFTKLPGKTAGRSSSAVKHSNPSRPKSAMRRNSCGPAAAPMEQPASLGAWGKVTVKKKSSASESPSLGAWGKVGLKSKSKPAARIPADSPLGIPVKTKKSKANIPADSPLGIPVKTKKSKAKKAEEGGGLRRSNSFGQKISLRLGRKSKKPSLKEELKAAEDFFKQMTIYDQMNPGSAAPIVKDPSEMDHNRAMGTFDVSDLDRIRGQIGGNTNADFDPMASFGSTGALSTASGKLRKSSSFGKALSKVNILSRFQKKKTTGTANATFKRSNTIGNDLANAPPVISIPAESSLAIPANREGQNVPSDDRSVASEVSLKKSSSFGKKLSLLGKLKKKGPSKSKQANATFKSQGTTSDLSRKAASSLAPIPADSPLALPLKNKPSYEASEQSSISQDCDDASVGSSVSTSRKKKKKKGFSRKLKSSLGFGPRKEKFEQNFDAASFFGVPTSECSTNEYSITSDRAPSELSEQISERDEDKLQDINEEEEKKTDEEEKKTDEECEVDEPKVQKSSLKIKTLQESLQRCRGSDAPNLVPTRKQDATKDGAVPPRAQLTSEEYVVSDLGQYLADLKGEAAVNESFRTQSLTDSERSEKEEKLKWGNVHVREYSQCLGDNPACSEGAPIQLDWDYQVIGDQHLDKYEASRPVIKREPAAKTEGKSARKRDESSLRIPQAYRYFMLLSMGYTPEHLAMATQLKQRDQKRRMQTLSRLKLMSVDEQVQKLKQMAVKELAKKMDPEDLAKAIEGVSAALEAKDNDDAQSVGVQSVDVDDVAPTVNPTEVAC